MQPVRKEIKNFLQEDTHMIRIGISGFGRIGRLAARVALRRGDATYLANRVYGRRGSQKVGVMKSLIKCDLNNPSNWYLNWNGKIGINIE